MKRILQDINNQTFRTVYVLYGQETYLQKQYRDNLLKALVDEGDTMNVWRVQGKEYSIPQLIDFAETMPFLAKRRVIVLESTGIFKSGGEALATYFSEPCETTTWVLVETECDKRSKLFKAADKAGLCIEFPIQDEKTLKKWILGILKKENKQITEATLDLFLERVGNDMNIIRLELEKLFCYTWNRTAIEREDVEAVCIFKVTGHIFDMVDAIGMGEQRKALDLYHELQLLREPPIRILFLITRHMNILLQIKDLKKRGFDNKSMASQIGIPPFTVSKYVKQAGLYKTKQLKQALEQCIQADEAIKRGMMQDKLSVETLIFELTQEKKVERKETV